MKSDDIYVIQRFEVKRIVDDFINCSEARKINQTKVDDLYNRLLVYTQVDEITKQQHVQNLKKLHVVNEIHEELLAELEITVLEEPTEQEKEEKPKGVDSKVCPLCGKQLVLRTARYGKYAGRDFLGCSGYPNCKYIKNIE